MEIIMTFKRDLTEPEKDKIRAVTDHYPSDGDGAYTGDGDFKYWLGYDYDYEDGDTDQSREQDFENAEAQCHAIHELDLPVISLRLIDGTQFGHLVRRLGE